MQTIVPIKDGRWSNLAAIGFSLTVAGAALWGDHYSHAEVSIFVWIFASIFVLFCWVPISAIRRPKSRLLAMDGSHLLWRIYNGQTKAAILSAWPETPSSPARWAFVGKSRGNVPTKMVVDLGFCGGFRC